MLELDSFSVVQHLPRGQRAMLRHLSREGSLHALGPWQMRTVRSLLECELVRPRPPGRTGGDAQGLWFLSAKGHRILPRHPSEARGAEACRVPPQPHTSPAEMPR